MRSTLPAALLLTTSLRFSGQASQACLDCIAGVDQCFDVESACDSACGSDDGSGDDDSGGDGIGNLTGLGQGRE